MNGFREFEFDLPDALLGALVRVLDAMEPGILSLQTVAAIPNAQGVYQLILGDQVVYIGKTDAEAGLRKRLERHARTVQHRLNLDEGSVRFKAVRIFVFTALDLETQLIRHYRKPAWNNSGFGSNDPGRERDTTKLAANHFDVLYPIDLDRVIESGLAGICEGGEVVDFLREVLPYTFRIETVAPGSRAILPEVLEAEVSIPPAPHSARILVSALVRSLKPGWQATALAGRIILYSKNGEYPGHVIARS